MNISVVGQGYVGLPVALAISGAGHKVFGIDSNTMVVTGLNEGKSHIEDIKDIEIQKLNEFGNYTATSDFTYISKSEVIVVCLPTPLFESSVPDLSILQNAVIDIAKNLKSGSLVIIESTIQPGTTRKLILPLILNNSGLGIEDFDLAFSPERIDPTNLNWNLHNTPKLVAGLNSKSCSRAAEFYSSFINQVYECETLEIAETAKLLENTFRLVNIALINEFTQLCAATDINVHEVIDAASSKPYGFMPFRPGVGVGGHCIPVDPLYLTWWARQNGRRAEFVETADSINHTMPKYVAQRTLELVDSSVTEPRVLILGVAYKPGVGDVRETPVSHLRDYLNARGVEVAWHDPLVHTWDGSESVELEWECDVVVLATNQPGMDIERLIARGVQILDCTNSLKKLPGVTSL